LKVNYLFLLVTFCKHTAKTTCFSEGSVLIVNPLSPFHTLSSRPSPEHIHAILWGLWSEKVVCWYKMQECRIYSFQFFKFNGKHTATGTDTDFLLKLPCVSISHLLLVSVMVVVVAVAVRFPLVTTWFTDGGVSLQQYNR
jgi:hypothetical protein